MPVDRRTFMRLTTAGLSSALLPLVSCAKQIGQPVGATGYPTPKSPLTPTAAWYQMSIQGAYDADRETYRLKIGGVADRALSLSDSSLRTQFPPAKELITLSCVGNAPNGPLLSSSLFRGARLVDLIDAAGVAPEATGALITGLDGFAAFQSIKDLRRRESMIAYDMGVSEAELAALPIEHGFPARVLTPGLYGYMQPKWIDSITFLDQGGYEEILHRSINYLGGAMQLASGFSKPRGGRVSPGDREVVGYAFGDGRPIGAVHISVDDGPWAPAEIVWNSPTDALPPYLWCLWSFAWKATPGDHTLKSRATYVDGETQKPGREFPYSGGSLSSIKLVVPEST